MFRWLPLMAVALLFVAAQARAHQVHVFAMADGSTIQGEVYFRGGEAARDAKVKALGAAGELLAETTTDQKGEFSFPARYRCDYRVVVDVGGGHVAEYTVSADELPASLPLPGASSAASEAPHGDTKDTESASASVEIASADKPMLAEQLESLNKQVIQLRKELDGYEQKTRFRDILGGIGYILGLMGLWGYFLGGRRRSRKQ